MKETREGHEIGSRRGELGPEGKPLRIRVGAPGKHVLHAKGVPAETWTAGTPRILARHEQTRNEEDKLILDGSTRRGQRIAARLATNDEFPLRVDRGGMSRLQETLPTPSLSARIAKLKAQRLVSSGTSPRAGRTSECGIPDPSPAAGMPNRLDQKLAALEFVKRKAYLGHRGSCLSEDSLSRNYPIFRLRVLPDSPTENTSPATTLQTPSRRRVRWWDEVRTISWLVP